MCTVDHADVRPGYLIDAEVKSFAQPAILTRILAHYKEMQLTDQQIRRLLDVARDYSQQYLRASVAFAGVTASLDLVEARPNIPRRRRLLVSHAELFRQHEDLLLRAHERTERILSPAQMRRSADLYQRDKRLLLTRLESSLNRAVRPSHRVVRTSPRHRAIRT